MVGIGTFVSTFMHVGLCNNDTYDIIHNAAACTSEKTLDIFLRNVFSLLCCFVLTVLLEVIQYINPYIPTQTLEED